MSTLEYLESTISEVFKGENFTNESVMSYISGEGILYSICEEPEDLEILKQSYE
mgnify:CR=1 FL=1